RNCASGMQAIDSAVQSLRTGRASLVLAGGVDALSRAPVLFDSRFVHLMGQWRQARSLVGKLQALFRFRPSHLAPTLGLLKGLTDPVAGLSMGQTAENLATQFNITREQMDVFAQRSHDRAQASQQRLTESEVVPLVDSKGRVYSIDDGVRGDSSH